MIASNLNGKAVSTSKPGLAPALALALGLAGCAGAKPRPVVPASTPHAPVGVNPFEGARLYVNPDYARSVEAVAAKHPAQAEQLKKVAVLPTAVWLSSIADTRDLPRHLETAKQQTASGGQPTVPVFVVYNLPNRDCNAAASAGELPATADGEARYQRDYIDVITAAFAAHPDQRVAVVLEPDSLGNLVTNLENPKCQAAEGIYKRGIAYAISRLSMPHVFIYLDAAHGGWLGWPRNLAKSVPLFKEILEMAGGTDRIRGFATNVSNYQPPKDLTNAKRNPNVAPNDEVSYVADLAKALNDGGITNKGFVIDTGRGGKQFIKTTGANWCNIKGAGLGERPTVAPAPLVDAYLYIKPPGESDGVADPSAKRFDKNCASEDATPGAPEAGQMFDTYLLELIKNATPPL